MESNSIAPNQQPLVPPPPHHFSKTFIILIVILITAAVGIGGYILGANQNQVVQNQPQPVPPTSQPFPTLTTATSPAPNGDRANWKTYRNEEFGFEIKYPADWKFKTTEGTRINEYEDKFNLPRVYVGGSLCYSSPEISDLILWADSDDIPRKSFRISVLDIRNKEDFYVQNTTRDFNPKSRDDFRKATNLVDLIRDLKNESIDNTVSKEQEFVPINGVSSRHYMPMKMRGPCGGNYFEEYQLVVGNSLFVIQFGQLSVDGSEEYDNRTFDQILSTFRFSN